LAGTVAGISSSAEGETVLNRDVEKRVKFIQELVTMSMRGQLFPDILEAAGVKTDEIPKAVWNEVVPSDKNRKAKRITSYIETGVLVPEDVREDILKEEGLPVTPLPKQPEVPEESMEPENPKVDPKVKPKGRTKKSEPKEPLDTTEETK